MLKLETYTKNISNIFVLEIMSNLLCRNVVTNQYPYTCCNKLLCIICIELKINDHQNGSVKQCGAQVSSYCVTSTFIPFLVISYSCDGWFHIFIKNPQYESKGVKWVSKTMLPWSTPHGFFVNGWPNDP
jgi:hypothetical protein